MRRFALILLLATPTFGFADEQDDDVARQLAKLVRDPRQLLRARTEAAKTLGKLGPRAAAAVPELVAQIKRLRGAELEPLQEAIIEALGLIGSPARSALPALTAATGRSIDIDQIVKKTTEQIIHSADSQDVGRLTQQLLSQDDSLRVRAAKALGKLGPAGKSAVMALAAVLLDPDGDVRRAAVVALRQIDPEAKLTDGLVKSIAMDLQDPDDGVRLLAARALGRFGPAAASAVPALQNLLNDPDRDVKKAATDALSRIAP